MKRLLFLQIAIFLLYWKILQIGFVFDDRFLIIQYDDLDWNRIWQSELWSFSENRTGFYRPLFLCSLYLDQLLFEKNALGYHVHSLLWHLSAVCSLWVILFRKKEYFGFSDVEVFLATAIFGLHPFCSEVVYWISARNDSMCLTLSLLSIFFLWREQPRWVLGGFCFFGALLSKETAVALMPAVLFLESKHRKWIGILIGGVLLQWFLLRSMILTDFQSLVLHSEHLSQIPIVFIDQLARFWIPLNLSPAQTIILLSIPWWKWLLGGLTLYWLGRSFWIDPKMRFWIVFGAGAMIVTIPPITHTGIFGDRYWIYALPMWGIHLSRELNWKMLTPLLFGWAIMVWNQGDAWKDDYSFWERQYKQTPNSFTAVSFAHISYERSELNQAYLLYQEGYSASSPYLYGCDNFLTLALKLEGAQRAIQASSWLEMKECRWTAAGWGVLAVAYTVEQDWNKVREILQREEVDPFRRLDLVQAIVYLQDGAEEEFCEIWNSWSNQASLRKQIKIISPLQPILECND